VEKREWEREKVVWVGFAVRFCFYDDDLLTTYLSGPGAEREEWRGEEEEEERSGREFAARRSKLLFISSVLSRRALCSESLLEIDSTLTGIKTGALS